MKKKSWLIAALAAASMATIPAQAADNGVYLGASVGYASLNEGFEGEDFDGSATGFKGILGWRFLDWLAVEANYVDFGSMDDDVFGEEVGIDTNGVSLSALAFLPVGPVDLFARVGIIDWSTDIEIDDFEDIEDFGDSGTDFAWGAGVQFRLGSLALRAEYESFDLGGTNVNMVSAGLTWTFF